MKKTSKKVRVAVDLTLSDYEKLRNFSEGSGLPMTIILKLSINDYIKRAEEEKKLNATPQT